MCSVFWPGGATELIRPFRNSARKPHPPATPTRCVICTYPISYICVLLHLCLPYLQISENLWPMMYQVLSFELSFELSHTLSYM
jgi:hypothetical protein